MRRLTFGMAVVAALAIGYGCDTSKADDANASGAISVDDITENPDKYIGQTVTIEGEVDEVHGPDAFSLDEENPVAGGVDNDLLVLGPQAASLEDLDDQWLNDKVRVTGTIGKLSVVEVEREVGWDLSPELEVEVEGAKAVLIAKSVARVQ
jgi:hypothetical protein